MITDEGIQRIKKNLPAYELKLFQSFLSDYHNTKQMLETKEFELSGGKQVKSCETNKTIIDKEHPELLKFIGNLRCTQCDHYVNFEWSAYDGKMYCQECWDYNRQEEELQRQKEITKLKARLAELEEHE